MARIRLGISSCLLGNTVRYDGGHKLDHYLKGTLGRYIDWVAVCPEVEYGLPVPREPMHLAGTARSYRLIKKRTGTDHTQGMRRWAGRRIDELKEQDLCGFVFKSRSPSCGMKNVKVHDPSSKVTRLLGVGIFAGAFMNCFPYIPVEDEDRLEDPLLRENFIERAFVYRRWKEFQSGAKKAGDLVSFHTDHKLLLLSHSRWHYEILGNLVANHERYRSELLYSEYIGNLMKGLKLIATRKKHTNVLQHIIGYFRKKISTDEKKELRGLIERYHDGLLPLIVPVTLINHYARKFDEQYLLRQYYLSPHPLELLLRNHA